MLLFPSPLWFRGKHTSGATGPSSDSRVWGEAGYESVLEWAPAQAAFFPPDSLASCLYPGQSQGISSFGGWYIRCMEIQGNFQSNRRNLSDFCTLSLHFLGELSRLSNCITLFSTHSNLCVRALFSLPTPPTTADAGPTTPRLQLSKSGLWFWAPPGVHTHVHQLEILKNTIAWVVEDYPPPPGIQVFSQDCIFFHENHVSYFIL